MRFIANIVREDCVARVYAMYTRVNFAHTAWQSDTPCYFSPL